MGVFFFLIRDSHFVELVIARVLTLLFAICFKTWFFSAFFQHLAIFDQKCRVLTPLKSVYLIFSTQLLTCFIDDVKLMYANCSVFHGSGAPMGAHSILPIVWAGYAFVDFSWVLGGHGYEQFLVMSLAVILWIDNQTFNQVNMLINDIGN